MSQKILIVEDDYDIRSSLAWLLELEGYDTVTSSNGQEAVEYLSSNPDSLPSLILLDLMMPIMDGHSFLRWFKTQTFSSVSVIVVSAAKDLGPTLGTKFIKKPLDLDELIGSIKNLTSKVHP